MNGWWSRNQRREAPQILSDGSQNKLILGASWTTKPKPTKPRDGLQVCGQASIAATLVGIKWQRRCPAQTGLPVACAQQDCKAVSPHRGLLALQRDPPCGPAICWGDTRAAKTCMRLYADLLQDRSTGICRSLLLRRAGRPVLPQPSPSTIVAGVAAFPPLFRQWLTARRRETPQSVLPRRQAAARPRTASVTHF